MPIHHNNRNRKDSYRKNIQRKKSPTKSFDQDEIIQL